MVYQILILIALVFAVRLYLKKQQEKKVRQQEKEESFKVPENGGVL